jgi:hypothetical protein
MRYCFFLTALALSTLFATVPGRAEPPGPHRKAGAFLYDQADETVRAAMLDNAEYYAPSIACRDGEVWMAWLEFVPGEGDHLWLGRRNGGKWDVRKKVTDKIRLVFRSGEHWMGERFKASTPPAFEVEVDGTAPLESLTVYRNGNPLRELEVGEDETSLRATFTPELSPDGEHYLYVHLVQADGNRAWSSPIWVEVGKPPAAAE